MARLSVLIVAPAPPPYGGMSLQAGALQQQLEQEGVSAELLPTNPQGDRIFGRLKYLRTVAQTVIFVKNLTSGLRRTETVHLLGASHWYFVLRVAPTVVLARLLSRRVILNYRGGEAPMFFARFKWLVLPVLRLVDAIVVPSEFLNRVFAEYGFCAAVIPNFVDLKRFQFRSRDKIRPNLLVTRSLEPLYNVKMALQAFAIVQKTYPEARIDIVGSGSEETALKNWVSQQGWRGVRFHGAVPNEKVPAYLERADILLNPSNADNMPINLLEAFASGIPVVTTNVGGIPDLVGDEKAALLVEPRDPTQMAAKIEELLRDPNKVIRITRYAKSLCQQMSWQRIGQLWLRLYGASLVGSGVQSATR